MKALQRLDALANNERSRTFTGYSLASISALLDRMGNPHRTLRTIHIAGTNGKGATAHFVQRILSSAGFRTGLYTSPHLVSVNERIRVDDVLIDELSFEKIAEEVMSIVDGNPDIAPTWFDAVTACAFRYFQLRGVDYAVIEAGLGGRLDSTNVITPVVSIITSIGMDHTAVLGTTEEAIAREKGGIIKPGVPSVWAVTGPARDVLWDIAHSRSSIALEYGNDFIARDRGVAHDTRRRFDYACFGNDALGLPARMVPDISLSHVLPLQMINASLAITAARIVKKDAIGDGIIRRALGSCIVPGRMEVLSTRPLVIFDPAHNVPAMRSVCEYVREAYPERTIIAVLHCMADKDVDGMIACIQNRLTDLIFYAIQSGERAFVPDARYQNSLMILEKESELAEALSRQDADAVIFFTGSFRLYSCAKRVAEKLLRSREEPA